LPTEKPWRKSPGSVRSWSESKLCGQEPVRELPPLRERAGVSHLVGADGEPLNPSSFPQYRNMGFPITCRTLGRYWLTS